jgi:hypothetical protein
MDFLKFPRQTLKQKAGDCDHLTVLFCSLLESVGIESAFITVPGHIFPAVCLGVPHAEAARFVGSLDELIFLVGRTWLPLEITEMDGGFLQAWEACAARRKLSSGGPMRRLCHATSGWMSWSPTTSVRCWVLRGPYTS